MNIAQTVSINTSTTHSQTLAGRSLPSHFNVGVIGTHHHE